MNFFLGCVGITQVTRIYLHSRSGKDGTTAEIITEDAKDMKETAKGVIEDVESTAKKVTD